jgi:hypothetical protein
LIYSYPDIDVNIRKINKKLLYALAACFFFSASFLQAHTLEKKTGLIIKSQTLSADIKDVPLKDILSQLEIERGLWFKCETSLLGKKVSVRFENLSVEDALNRILVHFNHSLIFKKDGTLIGAYVLENGKAGSLTTIRSNGSAKEATGEPELAIIKQNIPLPGGISYAPGERELFMVEEIAVSREEGKLFTVEENAPPPGGLSYAPGERELFMVEDPVCPPGGGAEVPPKTPEIKVEKSTQLTGDAAPFNQENTEVGQIQKARRPHASIQ